ncbi:glutaredoxin family protein [Methanogenium marinum]|uniref:Glutaredoxin family protein n=1 Tax=Methanogenium marinum TaxID=348610 RepID=A0A9Q4PXK4_9EURY|nr:glutaredoxin family protein [Methanogenium marinum]MDE4907198.1 glutaredoxin family protein [Methanogenium marinum]
MEFTHVDGDDTIAVTIFSLSTCGHCRRTKTFLQEKGIAYDYIDVDLLSGETFTEVYDLVKSYNPRGSFPTIVIGEKKQVIVGDRLDEIAAAVGIAI